MNQHILDFERPIADLEAKIAELRMVGNDGDLNINDEITRLQVKCDNLKKSIFSDLSPWQVAKIARHPSRPHTIDYIQRVFDDFDELHGDRHYSNSTAIIGGIAYLAETPVMVIGHEKGHKTKEKVYRNFGMAKPEDYRKALRLMRLAEKFNLPIITLIDTSGAYPGIGAEERNQSEAIARNLFVMSQLRTPIICSIIGEGGSGGALAIGVGDRVLMLQYSIYSVISPEGCASILWRSADKAAEAAEAMGITADQLHKHGLIDEIIEEPLAGAHRDIDDSAERLKQALLTNLIDLQNRPIEQLLQTRYHKLMAIGVNN